jgi:signal transduction histidine kinase
VEQPLHPVLGHEAYLTQCVTNLLANAVKFVAAGVVPKIRIRSERCDGKVRVWFEDNGIGIDPAHHERIFQIFGQVYPEERYSGTGIGLAIVRKAVQRMSGAVGVESMLDKGCRFWLILNQGKYDEDQSRVTAGRG